MPGQLSLFKGKRQRGTAPPPPSEFGLTCSVADLFRKCAKPTWQWTHVGHGEERTKMAGIRLKRAGQQKGWPDFLLIAPVDHVRAGVAHCLELKRKRTGRLSEDQKVFRDWCVANGVPYEIARDVDEVIAVGNRWKLWRGGVEVQ